MKNNYLKVIKDTLELEENIIILSLKDVGINEHGHEIIVIYINNIENSLSFFKQNESSSHIPIEGYSIHLIELGYLIKSIYHNPRSFLFINYLKSQSDYIIDDDLYTTIIDLIQDNLPLFLMKTFINDKIIHMEETKEPSILYFRTQDFAILLNMCQYLIENNYVDYDINFLTKYIGRAATESLFIEATYDLGGFRQEMNNQFCPEKISEGFIRKLDELYINMQIIHSTINID